jgi:hypothetical protein
MRISASQFATLCWKVRGQRTVSRELGLAATYGFTYNGWMQSPILTLLLIVNLLACPVRCLSYETTAWMETEVASTACCCCTPDECNPSSETPEPCGADCCCQDCICEGAISDPRVDLSDVHLLVSWELPTYREVGLAHCDSVLHWNYLLAPNEHLLYGRVRCIAHQSWLI